MKKPDLAPPSLASKAAGSRGPRGHEKESIDSGLVFKHLCANLRSKETRLASVFSGGSARDPTDVVIHHQRRTQTRVHAPDQPARFFDPPPRLGASISTSSPKKPRRRL